MVALCKSAVLIVLDLSVTLHPIHLFIVDIKNQPNRGFFGRKALDGGDSFILRATSAAHNAHLPDKMGF